MILQLLLDGFESVYIPLKFQSFRCGPLDESDNMNALAFPTAAGVRVGPSYEGIRARRIQVAASPLPSLSPLVA